jgi:hypothetical protein
MDMSIEAIKRAVEAQNKKLMDMAKEISKVANDIRKIHDKNHLS